MTSVPFFGVVAPGRPVITDFSPVPPGFGAVLYYSVPPFQQWEIIGAISPEKPSGIFRTSWATKEDMIGCPLVQLGVSLESLDTIKNLDLLLSGVDDRRQFAHKIALDLFQFMTSFSHPCQNGQMIIPTNLLDRWMEKFDRKYSMDPNFMMKNNL